MTCITALLLLLQGDIISFGTCMRSLVPIGSLIDTM